MSSKAVNRPTDPKFKEQDVNNKLQTYGIYSAFAKGKAPSNKQIDVALNSALTSKVLVNPPEKLSDEGKKLVGDVREVIEQAKLLLLSKNEGNLLQEFIWETQNITGADAKLPGAPVDKDTAQQHGNEALEGLRTLGTLILSNGQFRKLLSDATILVRSIAGDAATNVAGKVHPGEEKLNQIDQPAEDNTWHEVPDLSKQAFKDQAKNRSPFSKNDLKQAGQEGTQAAHPQGSSDPADVANLAAHEQQTGTNQGVNAAGGLDAAAHNLNQTLDQNAPEQKQRAKEYNERTQNYLKKQMPKERREQTIWRLKKMVVEIQGHADYQRAIETLLRLAEEYTGHSKNLATQGQGTVKGAHSDNSLKTAEANLQTLLERFANGTSSADFFESLDQIYRDADQDAELKGWFRSVDAYIRRCLREQGYIIQPQANDDFNKLYDQGQYLLRNKYRSHTDRILEEVKFFGNQFDQDPQNHAFANAVTKLFLDLGNDENGKSTFKPHLLKDVTEVILPLFLESVHYIPIPRIEYSDPQVDLIIENLIVESDNLAPNVLEFGSDNNFKWGRKASNKSHRHNKIDLAISGVQMDLRDVSFYVNRKQGFPSIKDKGLADIFLGGEGFSFRIKGESATKGAGHFFKITDVKVQIKNFNIKLKKSSHKLLFAIGKPLLIRALRPALQKALQSVIKQKANELDELLYGVQQEVNKAKAEAKRNPDPENIQNIYQQYYSAFQRRLTEAKQKKEKVEKKAENVRFNTAMTKHDSIFPDIELPSGISTKATEYKDLAAKGDRWESPVFSIGSAKESTNIPKAPTVQRKSNAKDIVSRKQTTNLPSAPNRQPSFGEHGYTGNTGYSSQQNYSQHGYGQQQGYGQDSYGAPTGVYGQGTPANGNGNYGTATQQQPIGTGNGQYPVNTVPFEKEVNRAFDPATAQGRTFDPTTA